MDGESDTDSGSIYFTYKYIFYVMFKKLSIAYPIFTKELDLKMGYLGQSLEAKGSMKRKQCSSSSPTKIERKTIEKNRRDQMKNLYSTLKSLLPNQPSKVFSLLVLFFSFLLGFLSHLYLL